MEWPALLAANRIGASSSSAADCQKSAASRLRPTGAASMSQEATRWAPCQRSQNASGDQVAASSVFVALAGS